VIQALRNEFSGNRALIQPDFTLKNEKGKKKDLYP
jgi:hypothetical protein